MHLSTLIQYLAPQKSLSHFVGWLATRRTVWLKNWMIKKFIKRFQIDLTEAVFEKSDDYPTFNSFFNRKLKPGARPVVQDPNAIACPVDGFISQIGLIKKEKLFQAKGFEFELSDLLADTNLANQFIDGNFATMYLSPKDYHRVHMPLKGTLRETIFIPGKLFSVNELTTREVPKLFSRNERLVCVFDTTCGPMAVILVGAMLVGSINTVWDPRAIFSKKIMKTNHEKLQKISLEKGAELGHFNMGSTVILLFSKDKISWDTTLQENSHIRMGQSIANILSS